MLDRSDNIPHLINMRGPQWKRARSILAPTFSAAKMRRMSGIMASTVDTMLDLLNTAAGQQGGLVDCNEVRSLNFQ